MKPVIPPYVLRLGETASEVLDMITQLRKRGNGRQTVRSHSFTGQGDGYVALLRVSKLQLR